MHYFVKCSLFLGFGRTLTFRISIKKVKDERKRIFRDRDATSRLNFSRKIKKFKFSSEFYQRTQFISNFYRENKNLPLQFFISQRHKEI